MFRTFLVCLLALGWASTLQADDYTFGYWPNGWRKNKTESSNDVFVVETNAFVFSLDLDDFKKSGFEKWRSGKTYELATKRPAVDLKKIPPAKLLVEIEVDKTKYVANACRAGLDGGSNPLSHAKLFESGRHVQHYQFDELDFRSAAGKKLDCEADLGLVAWSDSLTFNLSATPSRPYRDGIREGVVGKGMAVLKKPVVIKHRSKFDQPVMTLETWVKIPRSLDNENHNRWIVCKNGNDKFDGNFGFKLLGSRGFVATMNVGGGQKNINLIRSGAVERDQWNYLAMTYDGEKMVFYVNGKKVGEKAINKKRASKIGPLIVGNSVPLNVGDRVLKCVVDQVRVWDRALSGEQIARLDRDHGRVADRKNPKASKRLVSDEGLVLNEDFENRGKLDEKLTWENAKVNLVLSAGYGNWKQERTVKRWVAGDRETTTLSCDVLKANQASDQASATAPSIQVVANGQPASVTLDPQKNCFASHVSRLKRTWKTGYTDIRDYDEFAITIEATSGERPIPFLLHLTDVANITGVCPVLCHADGTPTGIPVQLSKNWHDETVGAYLMAYTKFPASKSKQGYVLRLTYGFYGALPSASHAQLSLVGYGVGNNGRWDQLAIGCFGETICFDMDMSCVENTITDIRLLMARSGAGGTRWNWTDAGWGGDWLNIEGNRQKKLFPKETRTAYLSHGPCLTDVRHCGVYGANREVQADVQIQTLRTDDYSRSFQNFRYDFDKNVSAENAAIFKLGKSRSYSTPEIAYGNASGLIKKQAVPAGLKEGYVFVGDTTLSGPGPWWVAFPGGRPSDSGKGTGYKALVIRKFDAVVNGKTQIAPTFRATQYHSEGEEPNLSFELLAAKGKPAFKKGDFIDMDLELVTLPCTADDYYGPNEAFRKHLQDHPSSWKTAYREVQGNDLKVAVAGGKLVHQYPVAIQATDVEVTVDIAGGVGAVPISFAGLASTTGHTLYREIDGKRKKFDQAVHGNDFWQTDYDPSSKTYKLTFNLPLDGADRSRWVLVSRPEKP